MTYRQALKELRQFGDQLVGVHMIARIETGETAPRLSAFGRLDLEDDDPRLVSEDGAFASFYLLIDAFEFLPPTFTVTENDFMDADWNPGRDTLTFHFRGCELRIQRTPERRSPR
jgi:hypothetical protein